MAQTPQIRVLVESAGFLVANVVLDYWRKVCRRAAIEAAATIGIKSRGQIVIWLSVAVIAVLALLLWGSADASWDEFVWRAAFALVIVLIYPFAFLWKLLEIPAQVDTNKNAENARLASLCSAKRASVKRTRVLTVLLEQGNDLLAANIKEEEFPEWKRRLTEWEFVSLKFLASMYSQQQAVAFKTVEYRLKKFVRAVNDEHADLFFQTTERCRYLRSVIDREPDSWSIVDREQRAEAEALLSAFKDRLLAADRC